MPTVLYVSSAIGLGHASKDRAIAAELRRLRPGLDVVWLAGDPTADVLVGSGETLASENGRWIGATGIAERSMRDGRLNLVWYVYRALPSFFHNMRVVTAALRRTGADVVVGNEAWELYVPLVLRVLRLKTPFVMITDFVGLEVVEDSVAQRVGAWFLNALWSTDGGVFDARPHSMVFIGEPQDVTDSRFGWALPDRRAHALRLYDFVGHVVRFRPEEMADRGALRARLGYGEGPLVVCAAGGTRVGADLLAACAAAYPSLRERMPGLRMVIVAGPRLSPGSLRAPEGVDVLGYVERLYEHFACADAVVTQCGASSTTELAALGTPFVYVPVPGHYEQGLVARRLERYETGVRLELAEATREGLTSAVEAALARGRVPSGMPVDGARKVAVHVLRTLDGAVETAPPAR